jgi:hypothetical protein
MLRLIFKGFLNICGECDEALAKNDSGVCAECGSYNVYDLKRWSKFKYNNAKAAYKTEMNRLLQNIVALTLIIFIFCSPLLYFFLVIDHDIHQLTQQRQ